MSGAEALPDEIWEAILSGLDFISIVKCMRVCLRWHQTIHESPLLNYKIALGVAGYIDNPRNLDSPAEKFLRLSQRIIYWKELNWTERIEYRNEGSAPSKDMKYSRGIAIRLTWRPDQDTGPTSSERKLYEVLSVKRHPSGAEHPTRQIALPLEQEILAFDPGQNLLVVFSRVNEITQLHFLDINTMSTHPASNGELTLPKGSRVWAKEAQILRNLIAITYRNPNQADVICNDVLDWKLSKSIFKKWSPHHTASTFKLLSTARYVVVARQSSQQLEIGGHSIQVRMISGDELVAVYDLPSLTYPWKLGMALCRAETTSSLTSDTFAPYDSPFISPPYPKLLLFHLVFVGVSDLSAHLAVLSSTFFPTPEQLKPYPDRIIPWSDWGPFNTRMFVNHTIGPSVHMFRVSTPEYILDFNPLEVSRDLGLGNKENIVTEPTILPKSQKVFKEDICSSLPYRRVQHRVPSSGYNYPSYRLDDCLVVTESGKNIYAFI